MELHITVFINFYHGKLSRVQLSWMSVDHCHFESLIFSRMRAALMSIIHRTIELISWVFVGLIFTLKPSSMDLSENILLYGIQCTIIFTMKKFESSNFLAYLKVIL